MRFLHTSDWHLGRLFHGVHLTRDQEHLLDQLVDVIGQADLDAVLLAGDVYDRAVPPDDAVALLDDVLGRVVLGLGVPVVAIAGNHDSPRRLGFGSALLQAQGLHVVGPVARVPATVTLHDAHGPVHVHPVPYAEPSEVRIACGDEALRTHDASMRALVARCAPRADAAARHVLMAHAFVVGGEASASERPLSIGGAETVAVEAFDGFDYVALGHLHRPQRAGGREHVRYSGSLLKYSFSEVDHVKGVGLVEMGADGTCTHEHVALTPRRDVRIVEGAFADLLRGPAPGESRDDYLLARLTDTGTLHNPMARLQEVYPNALQLERPALHAGAEGGRARADHRTMSDRDLFADFFAQATGAPLDAAQEAVLLEVLEGRRRAQREEGA